MWISIVPNVPILPLVYFVSPPYVRRVDSCKSFVIKAKKVLYLFAHCRKLRSGNKTVYPTLGCTARLNNFVTVKYHCYICLLPLTFRVIRVYNCYWIH